MVQGRESLWRSAQCFFHCVYFLGCLNVELLIPSLLQTCPDEMAMTWQWFMVHAWGWEESWENNTFQSYAHNQRPPNFVPNNRIRCHQQTLFTDVQRTCSFPLNILKPFTCEEKQRKCLVAETPSPPNSFYTITAEAWLSDSTPVDPFQLSPSLRCGGDEKEIKRMLRSACWFQRLIRW